MLTDENKMKACIMFHHYFEVFENMRKVTKDHDKTAVIDTRKRFRAWEMEVGFIMKEGEYDLQRRKRVGPEQQVGRKKFVK
jgi:hypothetical protein